MKPNVKVLHFPLHLIKDAVNDFIEAGFFAVNHQTL